MQHRGRLRGGHRRGEEEALAQFATRCAQPFELSARFDPFDEHGHLELIAERDDGLQECVVVSALVRRAVERLVDLDEAWIEQHEVREREESGAKIIERDADAEAVEFFNYLQGVGDVEQGHNLGDLDDEAPR